MTCPIVELLHEQSAKWPHSPNQGWLSNSDPTVEFPYLAGFEDVSLLSS